MTIEEISELRKQDKARTLRKPNCIKENMSAEEHTELQQSFIIKNALIRLSQKKGVAQNFLPTSLINKLIIRKSFVVKSFKGLGTAKKPYKIDCKFGKGEIINAHEFFKKKKYPEFIKKNHCFGNCHTMSCLLARDKINSKIISGIYFNGEFSILHSVLEVENKYIIDFNIDMAIKKDFYFKLFHFEPLSILDGKDVLKSYDFINENLDAVKDVSIMYINFAHDDVIKTITEGKTQLKDMNLEK